MDYVDLGKRIRNQRQAMQWTQEDLAERVGVSTSFVGHIERGSRKASIETLVAFANALNVTTDYLLAESLTTWGMGTAPMGLTHNQRVAMQEIMTTLQSQLAAWDKPDPVDQD